VGDAVMVEPGLLHRSPPLRVVIGQNMTLAVDAAIWQLLQVLPFAVSVENE
jgi:hypothetical protein